MSYDHFVNVDKRQIEGTEQDICFSQWEDHLGFEKLFEVESENDDCQITGLDHLRLALICVRVYRLLDGTPWKNIKNVVYERDQCGALVEFHSKADAMTWKLANP